ncbi:MAG: hypothetical protein PHF61_08745 [Bacteroidales bacterium]|nr:hypothetical protein [Bacteroidales bacterium]
MPTISFDSDETNQLMEMLDVYFFVKELLLYNEVIDPEGYTSPQILNELRNAYDHVNRALRKKIGSENLGVTVKSGEEYVSQNIDKAIGHVYRACYDALDWLSLNMRQEIQENLAPYSHETIKAVIPNYYSELRIKMIDHEEKISELRAGKDIASLNQESLVEYTEIVKNLQDIRKQINNSLESLSEYEEKRNSEIHKVNHTTTMRDFGIALFIFAVGVIIEHYFNVV